jgi:hypothetical protein
MAKRREGEEETEVEERLCSSDQDQVVQVGESGDGRPMSPV